MQLGRTMDHRHFRKGQFDLASANRRAGMPCRVFFAVAFGAALCLILLD